MRSESGQLLRGALLGDVSVATAGHVDHGKSSLIRALTGIDPDRLPEERRREMTIELGFATVARPDGGRLALIDVPGHERLVETMVAGVGSIDAALLVVGADDGPMPQSVEHLTILRLLGIDRLVVAMSRSDLVDDDWLALTTGATRDLLSTHGYGDAPVLTVSARTGAGLDQLRSCLLLIPPRPRRTGTDIPAWLPIDRAFQLPGVGTIVAGTLTAGTIGRGDVVVIAPSGRHATVRQLETHGQRVESVSAGQRVAVNLGGLPIDEVRRGDVLSDRPTPAIRIIDVTVESAGVGPVPIRSGDRVRVLIGSDRVDATARLLGSEDEGGGRVRLARLRLHRPVAVMPGDRFVLRRPSPPLTLAGGVVLARYAALPPRMTAAYVDVLESLAIGDPEPELLRRLEAGPTSIRTAIFDLPVSAINLLRDGIVKGTTYVLSGSISPTGEPTPETVVVSENVWIRFRDRLLSELEASHRETPEAPGLSISTLRSQLPFPSAQVDELLALAARLGYVSQCGPAVALHGYRPRLRQSEHGPALHLLGSLADLPDGHLATSRDQLPSTVTFLEQTGQIVRFPGHRVMGRQQFQRVAASIIESIQAGVRVDLPAIRERYGVSRDAAQLLLERLDALGLTVRNGDVRALGADAVDWMARQREKRRIRLRGWLLRAWSGESSTERPTGPETEARDIVLISADAAGWVTTGATLLATGDADRRVATLRITNRADGTATPPSDPSLPLLGPGTIELDIIDGSSSAGVVTMIEAAINGIDFTRDQLRLLIPLAITGDSVATHLFQIGLTMATSGWDVLFYEDDVSTDVAGDRRIANRLGCLLERGLAIKPVVLAHEPRHQASIVEALMLAPEIVSILARRHGLDRDRIAITNLLAGYHRTLGDGQLIQRFWTIRDGTAP